MSWVVYDTNTGSVLDRNGWFWSEKPEINPFGRYERQAGPLLPWKYIDDLYDMYPMVRGSHRFNAVEVESLPEDALLTIMTEKIK